VEGEEEKGKEEAWRVRKQVLEGEKEKGKVLEGEEGREEGREEEEPRIFLAANFLSTLLWRY
jgi:hypothetical protein